MIYECFAEVSIRLHVDADSPEDAWNIVEHMSAEQIRAIGVATWAVKNSTRELPREA